mmetsp:Transcript_13580/g.29819  ORF Transcript_13580/g.29819 Transcript_13580/m.29819 type:complete len:222 (+) Transcript_13580:788-1453(+)
MHNLQTNCLKCRSNSYLPAGGALQQPLGHFVHVRGQKHHPRPARSDLLQRIEVLVEHQQIHHVLRRGARHAGGKVLDRFLEPHHDRLALPSHSQARQVHRLCLCLCALHLEHLLSLCALGGGLLEALGAVDLVHGVHHPLVGHQLRHQRLHDGDAIRAHHLGERLLQRDGDLVLGLESLVQSQLAHRRSDHVADVGAHLTLRVEQRVVCLVHLVAYNLVLY